MVVVVTVVVVVVWVVTVVVVASCSSSDGEESMAPIALVICTTADRVPVATLHDTVHVHSTLCTHALSAAAVHLKLL